MHALYKKTYAGSAFVRLVEEPPSLNAVNGSNHCDIYATATDDSICVTAHSDVVRKSGL